MMIFQDKNTFKKYLKKISIFSNEFLEEDTLS